MDSRKLFIGTSGWHYKHWKGTFYPAELKTEEWLNYYSNKFNTVEINNSFYRLPELETFKNWRKTVSNDFVFVIKASRYFTHAKKLIIDQPSIDNFFDKLKGLKEKAGPVLFQLPPSWKINLQRLADFLEAIPKSYRYTFEFRNETWLGDKLYELLAKHKVAFCIYELDGYTTPIRITTDFVYIRLHGPGEKYQGLYDDAKLKKWATRIKEWQNNGLEVYIYFDNDQAGYAAINAEKLKNLSV